jgi:hypothetical protein
MQSIDIICYIREWSIGRITLTEETQVTKNLSKCHSVHHKSHTNCRHNIKSRRENSTSSKLVKTHRIKRDSQNKLSLALEQIEHLCDGTLEGGGGSNEASEVEWEISKRQSYNDVRDKSSNWASIMYDSIALAY